LGVSPAYGRYDGERPAAAVSPVFTTFASALFDDNLFRFVQILLEQNQPPDRKALASRSWLNQPYDTAS
jgi:hypothetical protein